MRFEGTLKTWNDERGFGFIAPSQGGQDVFVHIKAFPARGARPAVGLAVSFEVELNREGKKRARAVRPLRPAARARRRSPAGPAQWGTATYFAIPVFMVLYLAIAIFWKVPGWVGGLYLAASVLALLVYANDKAAAEAGRQRVPESTLLLLGLAGGWPGAIVAQQVLRHKSIKVPFRAAFWGSVLVNVAGFVVLSAPPIRRFVLAQLST